MKHKLVIHSLKLGPKCIMLPIHLKMTDTMEESFTEAMVDTGATGVTHKVCFLIKLGVKLLHIIKMVNH